MANTYRRQINIYQVLPGIGLRCALGKRPQEMSCMLHYVLDHRGCMEQTANSRTFPEARPES